MATRVYTYTFTGSEAAGAIVLTDPFPAFTGAFTVAYSISPAPTGTINFQHQFVKGATPTVGWVLNQAVSATNLSGSNSATVGTPSGSWPFTDWTSYRLQYTNQLSANRAGKTLTITFSGVNVPSAIPCPYGTQPASGAPAIALVTDAAIAAACTLIGMPWLAVLFAPLVGYAIDVGALCGSGPPPMPLVTNDDLLSDASSRVAALQSSLWYTLCECKPGTPSPVPYPLPTGSKPTGWPDEPTYSCDPANLCATLIQIQKRLDQLSQTDQNILELVTTVQRYKAPTSSTAGTARTGLSGAGSFAISRPLGFRVDVTARPPGRALEGTPPYLWNLGWLSISDGTRMIEEKRLSQTSFEWYPQDGSIATTFSYWLYDGVVITVTPLAVPA